MTRTETSPWKQGGRHRLWGPMLLAVALIGAVLFLASFMVDWSPPSNASVESDNTAQHSRLPKVHMRF